MTTTIYNLKRKHIDYTYTTEFVYEEILGKLPEKKLRSLNNALRRNYLLTSVFGLEDMYVTVYKEGWYVQCRGTRCMFSVFAKDNDGTVEILDRKPRNLNYLYDYSTKPQEFDWDKIAEYNSDNSEHYTLGEQLEDNGYETYGDGSDLLRWRNRDLY